MLTAARRAGGSISYTHPMKKIDAFASVFFYMGRVMGFEESGYHKLTSIFSTFYTV